MNLILKQVYCPTKLLTCTFLLLFSLSFSFAQDQFDITYGINAGFVWNPRGGTSISLSAAIGFKRKTFPSDIDIKGDSNIKNDKNYVTQWSARHVSPAFQSAVTIYYNGLGDNILDHFKAVNIDFVNSLFITLGMGQFNKLEKINHRNIFVQPFNLKTANVIEDNNFNSISIGTNFILNNHNRNQLIGFANAQIDRRIHLGYYNDGPPFNSIFLADGYDRWWTGGGFIKLYFTQGLRDDFSDNIIMNSSIALTYDRFTGDIQEAYLSSGVFGFYYVPTKDKIENFYTRARYRLSYKHFRANYEFFYQAMGHLNFDIQDKIHNGLKMPHHLSYSTQLNSGGLLYHRVHTID